jgi:hypothetical protein
MMLIVQLGNNTSIKQQSCHNQFQVAPVTDPFALHKIPQRQPLQPWLISPPPPLLLLLLLMPMMPMMMRTTTLLLTSNDERCYRTRCLGQQPT